jgi:SAM-dependent methyltransferase
MSTDRRTNAAKYYDLSPDAPRDINFYLERVPFPAARVLELGCGTGRVLVPLTQACSYVHGVDISAAMIAVCCEKVKAAGIPETRARAEVRDITSFALNQHFELIIAPYRVFQLLETEIAVMSTFACIRQHLAPGGSCILNVFNPNGDPETLRTQWCTEKEKLCWEVSIEGGRVTCHDRRPRMDPEKMILYPELIYRRYSGEALVDEATLKIAMRCYYPEEFLQLVTKQGFRVLRQWGGYAAEPYGQGPELIVQFTHGR